MPRNLTRNQENSLIIALGRPVAQILIDTINTWNQGGNKQRGAAPPLVKKTQPIYVADNDYVETIDGMIVTHLTVEAVKLF